jgi:predicted dehydrogenase
MRTVKVGVVGCGNISEIYLSNLQRRFSQTEVVAVADLDLARATERAREFDIPTVCASSEDLLEVEDVDIVLNLTIPRHHADVSRAALKAGRHVYEEKPLALSRQEGAELVELARARGLLLACAPDTFLGSAVQTCRKLIADGWIGVPFAATAHLLSSGPESWHPDPAFLYQTGAGPLFDSAPYFVTALAYLLGPIESVVCSAKTTYPERTITSQPHFGEKIKVEVPTFVVGGLTFESGALTSLVMSVDVGSSRMQDPRQHGHAIEVYGSEGTLSVPSPCYFDGQIYYRKDTMTEWTELPGLYRYTGNARGLGVADLASALLDDRPPRVTADLAYHVLDVLLGMDESWRNGQAVLVTSGFTVSEPLGLSGELDGLGPR